MANRKTAAERREEEFWAERQHWESFCFALRAAKSFEDLLAVAGANAPNSRRGGVFHTNLAFFLRFGYPPFGATHAEVALYEELRKRGLLRQATTAG